MFTMGSGGSRISRRRGRGPPIQVLFGKNVCENERIGSHRGACAWHAPLDLQMMGEQKVYFYFFKRPECYNQEVLSHSLICLPLPYMKGIGLICNINLYCVIAISNGHR